MASIASWVARSVKLESLLTKKFVSPSISTAVAGRQHRPATRAVISDALRTDKGQQKFRKLGNCILLIKNQGRM
jgi:hypothetical protein